MNLTGPRAEGVRDACMPNNLSELPGAWTSAPRCYATVLLDDEAWRSLAALDGERELAWVHGCALEHGHDGAHVSNTHRSGSLTYWIQWEDGGRPRIGTAARAPAADSHPAVDGRPATHDNWRAPRKPVQAATRGPANGAARREPAATESGSQTAALWAIAAALERLADICSAIVEADNRGSRHGGGHRD